jgi:hypothetical protein
MTSLGKNLTLILILILVFSISITIDSKLGLAQTGTNVSGVISSDATWTQANSPYSLSSPVAVNAGVTLTIEPGATINLNGYYVEINGTISAIGSDTDQIQINGPGPQQVFGGIIFNPNSSSWNKQTSSGSIIQDSILNFHFPSWPSSLAITIQGSAPRIDGNTINGNIAYPMGSPIISNNKINGGLSDNSAGGSPLILNNEINGSIEIDGSGSPIVENNTIYYPAQYDSSGNLLVPISGISVTNNNNALISDNRLLGNFTSGIWMQQADATIVGNLITTGLANGYGISINHLASIIMENNTIYGNKIEVYSQSTYPSTVVYNDLVNYSQNSIYLDTGASGSINATYNWWGTTDTQAINQTIHDFKDNFNLGEVTFVPFLTVPNPQTPPPNKLIPNTPIPNPSLTQAATATPIPTTPEFSPSTNFAIVVAMIIVTISKAHWRRPRYRHA